MKPKGNADVLSLVLFSGFWFAAKKDSKGCGNKSSKKINLGP